MITTLISALKNILSFTEVRDIVLICTLIGAVLGAISCLISVFAVKKRAKQSDKDIRKEARQSEQENEAQDTVTEEAITDGYFVMNRNVIYSVGLDGKLNVGKYTLENADGASDKFNMRVNGLVREYESGDIITLADGDTISPVSGAVVITVCKE